jgi:cellulose synthase/poly-beta-1,6-N-acetylglucosamine synthase-like glycosyltransferase
MRPFLQTFLKQKSFFQNFFDEEVVKSRFEVENLLDCKIKNQEEFDEFGHCFMQNYCCNDEDIPLKLVFCVKQMNKRKLNSHLWFFGGFCPMIKPRFVMMLDVGTRPLPGSLFYLYQAMDRDSQVAGCCGEIRPINFDFWKVVIPAQVVEYKFSHMLDKALESVIGYITVLPGAFSAYRWEALSGAPLWEDYFKSICHPELMDAFQSNIYLAEDRVLCLSLVTKRNEKYILRYVKKSIAETDVPDSISVLMAQRRRWINGSWFALVDTVRKIQKIYKSSHSCPRKFFFLLQMLYYLLNVIYTWFIVGLFCLAMVIAVRKNYIYDKYYFWIGDIIILFYISLLIIIFLLSMGVKPRRIEDAYKGLSFILGCYQVYIIYLICYFAYSQNFSYKPEVVVASILGTASVFALVVLLNCETITIIKGIFHYILLIPTYVNIFFIYSICNVHDCTWGNRPDVLTDEEKERLEEFEEFRTRWAIIWVLCNSGFAYVMSELDKQNNSVSFLFLASTAAAGVSIMILRALGGIVYLAVENFNDRKIKKTEEKEKNVKEKKLKESGKVLPEYQGNGLEHGKVNENEEDELKTKHLTGFDCTLRGKNEDFDNDFTVIEEFKKSSIGWKESRSASRKRDRISTSRTRNEREEDKIPEDINN